MDRFIVITVFGIYGNKSDLKSNMDRFIGDLSPTSSTPFILFKIQYG